MTILAALVLAGCGRDHGAADAMRVVEDLQAALRTGDRNRCRELVTVESATALSEIPWHEVRSKQSLSVVGAEPRDSGYRVQVLDPNDGGRRAEFVVVREYGRIVVDLVASAGLTATHVERAVESPEFTPRELTPRDLDRARQITLAAPPR